MAKLTYAGIDGILLEMESADKTLRARIDKALELSAAVMQEQLRLETRGFKQPTGELATKVAPGKIYPRDGGKAIDVWAQGTYTGRRGSPRRAETVAFVLEYGRTGQDKNPWHKRSRNKSKNRINGIMQEILGAGGFGK